MKPCILICDTCGTTTLERAATPEQKISLSPIRDGGALMLRRRAAAINRAQLGEVSACPTCGTPFVVIGSGPPTLPK